MRIRIDPDTCTFELRLCPRTYNAIEGDAAVHRTYSALTLAQLQALYQHTTGYSLTCTDYNAVLQTCKTLALRLLTAATEKETNDR